MRLIKYFQTKYSDAFSRWHCQWRIDTHTHTHTHTGYRTGTSIQHFEQCNQILSDKVFKMRLHCQEAHSHTHTHTHTQGTVRALVFGTLNNAIKYFKCENVAGCNRPATNRVITNHSPRWYSMGFSVMLCGAEFWYLPNTGALTVP